MRGVFTLCCECVVALLALGASTAAAQIYTGRSASGAVVLSTFQASESPTVLIARDGEVLDSNARPSVPAGDRAQPYRALLHEIAMETEIPESLLHAVIAVESAFDAAAVSPKGAQGLMQLMPATARRFGVADPFDPRENVRAGALYLKWLLDKFGGDLQLALAGYNAGEAAVVRAGYRIPPLIETQRYVPRVIALLQRAARS